MSYIDAHCHLADLRLEPTLGQVIARAESEGVAAFIQGGVGPEDWERQLALAQSHPGKIHPVFGLHPWWVDAHDEGEVDRALALLPNYLPKGVALGELGLDHGPRTRSESHAIQERAFRRQLDLAGEKPLVLHIVSAHQQALNILRESRKSWRGIVHAYTGSREVARQYVELGLTISVGGAVARKGFERLKQSVVALPLDQIVVESDAPDQPPPSFEGKLNEPSSLFETAQAIGTLKGVSAQEVLERSRDNLARIFGV